jgi:hypothetical protein
MSLVRFPIDINLKSLRLQLNARNITKIGFFYEFTGPISSEFDDSFVLGTESSDPKGKCQFMQISIGSFINHFHHLLLFIFNLFFLFY